MDAAQWPQGIGMEPSRAISERRPRPDKDKQALDCPRCSSTNTKFCYYNNYSLSQPRYFCKTCRRYWTEGGSLRNVPVGGGSRKNKRSSTSTTSSSSPSQSSSKRQPPHDLTTPNGFSQSTHQNPRTHDGQDLNLAYPPSTCNYLYTPSSSSHQIPSMELFKSGNIASIYNSSGFPVQEFKPSLNNHFSVDGYGNFQGVQEGSSGAARLFFPFEDLKLQATTSSGTTADFDHHQQNIRGEGDQASGYWSGMLGGGGGSWLA